MKKGRNGSKMTNAQSFSYPSTHPTFNKDLIAPNAIPNVKIRQIIWENLLDETNTELTITSERTTSLRSKLLNSVRFSIFVEKTREEFKKNYSDFRKFPTMNDDDWK